MASALAAPLVLIFALGGCSPEPVPEGAPPTTTGSEPSPADGATVTPESGDPADPSVSPSPSEAPSPADAPPSDGVPADDESGTDWQEPEDPLAEGPTAAPELPEVQGATDEAITLPTEVVVSLTSITTTSLTAETPGEYTGPAVIVTVHVANESSELQDVSSAVVSLSADDGDVGVPTGASPYAPLNGQVAAGETVEGTYVFMLDPAPGRAVTVSVNYSAGEPLAVFTGQTP